MSLVAIQKAELNNSALRVHTLLYTYINVDGGIFKCSWTFIQLRIGSE
jgi:hypothetical protein